MDINQIIIIVIVVLVSLIIILIMYFIITSIINKKKIKKENTIFDSSNLVEEAPLINVLEEKSKPTPPTPPAPKNEEVETFFLNQEINDVQPKTTDPTREEKINPFGVDLTMRRKDSSKIEIETPNNQNKFIK